MTCTRCGQPFLDPNVLKIQLHYRPAATEWILCVPCQRGLATWFTVRKAEFSPAAPDGHERSTTEAELLHACRQALDACGKFPQLLDTLRTAIKNALRSN